MTKHVKHFLPKNRNMENIGKWQPNNRSYKYNFTIYASKILTN